MEQLFYLAETITSQLKEALSLNRENIGIYNFDQAIVSNSQLELMFSGIDTCIKLKLSVHPLDTPWNINIYISKKGNEILLNDYYENISDDNPFEVYPKLLNNLDTLGLGFSKEITKKILSYLEKK